jgi:hypothetical protein
VAATLVVEVSALQKVTLRLGSLAKVRKSGGLGAATLRAWVLLRARWRAAVAFGLVAGLGAGGVIGLLTIARDTGS